ncbi:MAG: hypothetical protein Q8T03_02760 [Bacteroidota bacterium]|nr:hypothetical protein [Bacteroidota bacterium]
MSRDKARDYKYFNCNQTSEINYVSELYTDSKSINQLLKQSCLRNTIKYSTYEEIYILIKNTLGFPIPE